MKKKNYIYIVFFLILFLVLIFGYFSIYRQSQEEKLIYNVEKIAQQDFLEKVSFSSNSQGNYLLLEEAIEKYLDDFYQQYQKVMSYALRDETMSLLSVSNYSKDGKEFTQSISYVKEEKKLFNQDMKKLLSFCEKTKVYQYSEELELSTYYQDLFQDMIFEHGIYDQLLKLKTSFLESQESMNQVYDVSLDVFSFLKKHSDDWKVENNEIQFSTNLLVEEYQSLVSSIQD